MQKQKQKNFSKAKRQPQIGVKHCPFDKLISEWEFLNNSTWFYRPHFGRL